MLKFDYGDLMLLYLFGSISHQDTVENLRNICFCFTDKEINTQVVVLKEKISSISGRAWELFFPAVYKAVDQKIREEKLRWEENDKKIYERLTVEDEDDESDD